MTTATRGCNGKIKAIDLGGTIAVVGGIQSWSFTQESEEIDRSEIGTCTKASEAGAVKTSIELSGFWNTSSGAKQGDLTAGNVVDVQLFPGGSGSGSKYYSTATGEGATVLSQSISGEVDGLVSFSITASVNGALSILTVT